MTEGQYLSGRLLLAMPGMFDERFARTVNVMCVHDENGALGIDIGLEWGGSWKTIVDAPHFQLRPAWATTMSERQMLAELRTRRANETPVYA